MIDADNFSILTTRRLVTNENGIETKQNIHGATNKLYGDFKGYKDKPFTFGYIQLHDGSDMKYYI